MRAEWANMLILIQMADVLQRNSSLVELVEWNDFDSVFAPLWAWGPGQLRSLQRTHLATHPLHFNRNPQICCKWSPLRGIFPLSQACSQLLLHTTLSITKNVHFRVSTGNERWKKKVETASKNLHKPQVKWNDTRVCWNAKPALLSFKWIFKPKMTQLDL